MHHKAFQRMMWQWWKKYRRDLPWRRTRDPYHIFVSEVMLQQTQVQRVLPYYHGFLQAFPSLKALAGASFPKVLSVWQGLGYNRRALWLKRAAEELVRARKFPRDPLAWEALPGIGPYTARAISCFAFGRAEVVLETNIRKVFLHFFFPKRKKVSDREILVLAERVLDRRRPREWNWALMDYGARMLRNKALNLKSAHWRPPLKFQNSERQVKGMVVRILTREDSWTEKLLYQHIKEMLPVSPYTHNIFVFREVLQQLAHSGLIEARPKGLWRVAA